MPKNQLFVYANAVPGKDDEFNRWYNEQHLGDVLTVPGIVAAQRFTINSDKWRYLTIYELDTNNVEGVIAELRSRGGTERMPMTDAMDRKTVELSLVTALGERRTA
jgi:hypothetical protein